MMMMMMMRYDCRIFMIIIYIIIYNVDNVNCMNINKPQSTLHVGDSTGAEMLARRVGDYPSIPTRVPIKLTVQQSKALPTSNLYFWSPVSPIVGNMNEIGFDSQSNGGQFEALKELRENRNGTRLIKQQIRQRQQQHDHPHDGRVQLPGLTRAAAKQQQQQRSLIEVRAVASPPPVSMKVRHGWTEIPGPVKIAPPVRYPGDGDFPNLCHTPDELRAYLNYVGIDHDEEVGVQLVMTPYHNKRQKKQGHHEVYSWKTLHEKDKDVGYARKTKIDGFQYFWVHGQTTLDRRGRRCYDPKLDYENLVTEVGPDSHEVRWGCTPFRIFGKRLQQSLRCTISKIGKKNWEHIEMGMMHDLSFEAMRQPPEFFYKAIIHRVSKWLNQTNYSLYPINDIAPSAYSNKADADDIDKIKAEKESERRNMNMQRSVADCFKMEQRPLACTPVMAGSSGMREHGLSDFSAQWIRSIQDVVQTCHVPKGCVRLAAEQLIHFNMYRYSRIIPDLAAVRSPIWADQCRPPEGPWYRYINKGNSRLYASCVIKSLRHLCGVMTECCPTAVQHLACARNVTGSECSRVCQEFDPNEAFQLVS